MRKKKIWNIVFYIALVGCIGCAGFAGWYFWQRYQFEQKYQELLSEVIETETGAQEQQEQLPTYTLEEIENAEFTGIIDAPAPKIPAEVLTEMEDRPVDFTKLQEINPELYAWIRIPDTNIDYPVAQHAGEDQQFYLHHDMYQDPQFAGCIYSENYNSTDFGDPVTVLYGHNMANGSMFQNLYKFCERDFFNQHKYVYVYTQDETLVYEVYAAYYYDSRHILEHYDMNKAEDRKEYIEESAHPRSMEALVREGIEITEEDHILTLSTCVANQTGMRLLVQAALTYETEEQNALHDEAE